MKEYIIYGVEHMSFKELMEDVAMSYEGTGDIKSRDAVLMAINDPVMAKEKHPGRVVQIDNAIQYSKKQLELSGYSN